MKVIVIVVLLAVLFIYNYYRSYLMGVSELRKVKSGDLILSKTYHANYMTFLQTVFDMSPFTHVGIVYMSSNGMPYIVETHQKDKFHKSGLNIYPFMQRYHRYNGQLFINPIKIPLTIAQQSRFDEFIMNCGTGTKFPDNSDLLYNYVNRCMLGKEYKYDKCFNHANCAELVALILERVLHLGKTAGNIACKTPGMMAKSPLHTNNIIRIK